jgi:hypothetical protein
MHIVFQFPIVDFRLLLPGEKARLVQPSWPSPDMQRKPFIRHFGRVKQRLGGGSEDWSAEEFYCDSHLAIKYDDLHKSGYDIGAGRKTIISNCYRRLYSDGKFMNKIELGFVDDFETLLYYRQKQEPIGLIPVIKHYADLNVTVRGTPVRLFKAGSLLAANFCDSSTVRGMVDDKLHRYVVNGEICILVIVSPNESIELPREAVKIDDYKPNKYQSVQVHGYKLHHEGYSFKVWFLKLSRFEGILEAKNGLAVILRRIRINLARIHAEKETVRLLLNGINTGKVDLPQDGEKARLVDSYLKKTAEKLFKKTRANLDVQQVLDFALQSEDVAQPGSFSSLEESVYYFKDQYTRSNIDQLLEKMIVEHKKTILFITSSPKGKNLLNFGQELKKIKDALQSSADRAYYQIEVETGVQKDDFLKLLFRYKPDYIHITLHGSRANGLYFENAEGEALAMDTIEFSKILALYSLKKKPQAILLSACNSLGHAEAVRASTLFAMGTNQVFPDQAAIVYAQGFYELLFNDQTTDITLCHQAGLLGIELAKFDAIGGVPVRDIPVLLKS